MKTPEQIKKGLDECTRLGGCAACPYFFYHTMARCAPKLAADALTYIRELEAKLAEYEKPLAPMTLEEVLEKSKDVSDNVIWLESPDEEDPNEMDCLPALVSNLANFRANRIGIEYARFLMWPDEHVLFPVTDGTEYGKRWRCWPRKPTDEERKAAKWDD